MKLYREAETQEERMTWGLTILARRDEQAERDAKLGAAVRGATLDIFGDAKNAYNELAAEAAGCFFATDIDGEPTDEPSDSGWSRWIRRVAEAIIQQDALDAEAVPPVGEEAK